MTEFKTTDQRLTTLAHALVRSAVASGDTVIDATAGNGHDTAFLCDCVGKAGHVFALDVQECALEQARHRVMDAQGHSENVSFICDCHSSLEPLMSSLGVHGVTAVMFNLGYLPGADHALTTRPDTTLVALRAGCELLRPGGILSVLVYTGHRGGSDELSVVEALASDEADADIDWSRYVSLKSPNNAPQLFIARKRHQAPSPD